MRIIKRFFEEIGLIFLPSRLSRTDHFLCCLLWLIMPMLIFVLLVYMKADEWVGFLILITLINLCILKVKRLHDFDASGWWILALLIPGIGWLWGLAIFFIPGTEGANRFGERSNKPLLLIGWVLLLAICIAMYLVGKNS